MPGQEFDFGPFRLDVSARQLVKDGRAVPLTPKAFDVLLLLVHNPGRTVGKEEILRAVWPETFVEEGSLSQNVFQLRRAIGDDYIQTVARRGYRFNMPAATPAIAVLPFLNLTGDPEVDYFADGLADEIISSLAAIHDLRVPARSSTFQFRNATDIREVGRVLRVTSVLEGTVRKHGRRVKATAQLNSVSDGYCAWSDTYERDGEDALAIQNDIAVAIVNALKIRAVIPTRHAANPEAYHLYLKGRYFWNKRPAAIQTAMEFFRRAIEQDPRYGLAYVGLADCYSTQSAWESGVLAPREGFGKAKTLAARALEIDDLLGEAHTTLGYVHLHFDWDHEAAGREFRRAIALNPGYSVAHHWYSHALTACGRSPESLSESRRALELDPLDLITNAHMAWHHYYAGDIDAMEASVRALRELEPATQWSEFFQGWLCERQGRNADAVSAFERAVAVSQGSPVMKAALAHALAANGDTAVARGHIHELEEMARERYVSSYELAVAHAALGEVEKALELLERAYEERSAWMAYLHREPRLDCLRGDARFQELLARHR